MCHTICWMVLCQAFLSLLPPPPSPIKNLLSPIPLGRPDTQARQKLSSRCWRTRTSRHTVLAGYTRVTWNTHAWSNLYIPGFLRSAGVIWLCACVRYLWEIETQYDVWITCFRFGKFHPPRTFLSLEDSECFLILSLIVVLRSRFIASLKVLNHSLEDYLKKVYDNCVRFIQYWAYRGVNTCASLAKLVPFAIIGQEINFL